MQSQKTRRADAQSSAARPHTPSAAHEDDDAALSKAMDIVAKHLRKKHADQPDLLQNVETVLPTPQKTPSERRKDAFALCEKSRTQHQHQIKVLEQMRVSFSKQCEELLQYKVKVAEQEARAEEARVSAQNARDALDRIDANSSTAFAPPSSAAPPALPPFEYLKQQVYIALSNKFGGNAEVQGDLRKELAELFAGIPPPPPSDRLPPPISEPPAYIPTPQPHPTAPDMWGLWHENDMSVNEQISIIEEEERIYRQEQEKLAREQHAAELELHNMSGDDVVDGDKSHDVQQTGSRKTRVLPGPADEAQSQQRIDEAVQLASQNAGSAATLHSEQSSSSNMHSTPPDTSPAAPAPALSASSEQADGFTLVKGRGKGKPNPSGSNRRAAPYPGQKKSSS